MPGFIQQILADSRLQMKSTLRTKNLQVFKTKKLVFAIE